ncbi:GTPase-activating protein [Paramarasmius palmivorus]|uniref:GTPase-activating protein n=1 Tax=Paramarasmius palmivorus TaxID=297713 RepID=A0AAW0DRQ2_9AGAR
MSVNESNKPSASDVNTSLDSLLSPQADSTSFPPSARASLAVSELDEVALDDEPLSPVALSTRDSAAEPSISKGHDRNDSISSIKPVLDLELSSSQSHNKSASISTVRSGRLSFLVTREDGQNNRVSVDGQHKLQEEFARLQKEEKVREDEQHQDEAAGPVATIDWDFWGDVMSDYPKFAAERPEELAKEIAKGIPDTLRGMMWQLMAASKDPELEGTYLKLLKENSIHEKAILRDLGRTFPHHDFFTDGQGIGQENLYNVLKAYSLHDPQVGYCQGLPFVVAILLLNMPDEEAFSLLVRLMYVYDLRGHFLPEMPKLQLRLYQAQFDRLIEELLPVLHLPVRRSPASVIYIQSERPIELFLRSFPLEIVFRIYDNCLANGIEAIFGFSVALLHKNEDLLLNLKFDEILAFLNTKLFDRYKIEPEEEGAACKYRVDDFVNDAVSLRITPFMLDSYSHEYEDMMRQNNKHALEMDELRNSNRSLSAQVKNLESSLAQLNAEHVEVLNELVKCRLRNEEIESELVRYKLLYAEAMHENEDAQSSHRISINQMFNGLKRGSNSSRSS